KENVIIGKLIPAATGLKRYRTIEMTPEGMPAAMYARPDTEAELMAALQEIGSDGGSVDLAGLDLTFGGQPGDGDGDATSREFPEATDTPEVDSPLDEGTA
ncbi:MAG: hypothetical protein ACM33B_05375, partial [Pseudomonadota bacterium]